MNVRVFDPVSAACLEPAADEPDGHTGRCRNLPLQTISPRNPISTHLRSSAANYEANGSEFWSTVWYFKSRPIEFTLNSPCRRCNVTLSLVMRTCLPFPSAVAAIVNGKTCETFHPNDDNWFTQHITVPADFLQEGTNHFVLETPATARTRLGIPLGIWVQSISVGWNPGLMHTAGA
jgi:hypothetical protein